MHRYQEWVTNLVAKHDYRRRVTNLSAAQDFDSGQATMGLDVSEFLNERITISSVRITNQG
jgi:hypothetical protein